MLGYLITFFDDSTDFYGKQPKPTMQCCYAAWSKAKLQVGGKLIKLTGSEEQLPKNMSLVVRLAVIVKNLSKNVSQNACVLQW